MKESIYRRYDELPLFLNAKTVAKVPGISPSSGYELMHEQDFPSLRIGNRIVIPKDASAQCLTNAGNNPGVDQTSRCIFLLYVLFLRQYPATPGGGSAPPKVWRIGEDPDKSTGDPNWH